MPDEKDKAPAAQTVQAGDEKDKAPAAQTVQAGDEKDKAPAAQTVQAGDEKDKAPAAQTVQAGDANERRIRPMTPEEIRQVNAAAEAEVMQTALDRNATDLHEGGRYYVGGRMVNGKPQDGQWVDAEGRPLKGKD